MAHHRTIYHARYRAYLDWYGSYPLRARVDHDCPDDLGDHEAHWDIHSRAFCRAHPRWDGYDTYISWDSGADYCSLYHSSRCRKCDIFLSQVTGYRMSQKKTLTRIWVWIISWSRIRRELI